MKHLTHARVFNGLAHLSAESLFLYVAKGESGRRDSVVEGSSLNVCLISSMYHQACNNNWLVEANDWLFPSL